MTGRDLRVLVVGSAEVDEDDASARGLLGASAPTAATRECGQVRGEEEIDGYPVRLGAPHSSFGRTDETGDTMHTIEDLLRRLDTVGPDGWETEYSRHPVKMTRDQTVEAVATERPFAAWLAFRADAGPPGVPLPPYERAVHAVLVDRSGTPLDVYRVLFTPRSLPEDLPPDVVLAVLCNSAACALKGGVTWLAAWAAARAGLAALALGAPDRAWSLLDLLTIGGRRHPHIKKLAIFEPLRGTPALERDPWVRVTIEHLWPALGVPAIPRLPHLVETDDMVPVEATLDALARVGADHVRALVESFLAGAERAIAEERNNHPLVRDLRTRAMVPGGAAPLVETLPAWFEDWARHLDWRTEPHLARLVGLVLHQPQGGAPTFAAILMLQAARAEDLDVLRASLVGTDLGPLLDELVVAARALPADLADALVAVGIPHHVAAEPSLRKLTQHVDVVEGLPARPGSVVAWIKDTVRTLVSDALRAHETEGPRCERVLESVRRVAAGWQEVRFLREPDVQRMAARIDIPALTPGLPAVVAEAAGLSPLEALLLALALRRAVEGSALEVPWRSVFCKLASDAIYRLRVTALFTLRLGLLDELLADQDWQGSRAELYYHRGNTRHILAPGSPDATRLAMEDMRASAQLARGEGDSFRYSLATAAWVKLLASPDAGVAPPDDASIAGAQRALDEALALPLDPADRAPLHQARAHLLRPRSPLDAVKALDEALACTPGEDPFWVELAAESVQALVLADRVEEAAARGIDFLAGASCRTSLVELAMLHLATGEALARLGRAPEARRWLEAGLDLVRGSEDPNEVLAHLHLADLGAASGDMDLAREHLRVLRAHREALAPLAQRDLLAVEAAVAEASGEVDAQLAALLGVLNLAGDDPLRTRVRLQLACLDLAAGRAVESLDALIAHALTVPPDPGIGRVLTDLVCNNEAPLRPATREALIAWAHARRSPSLAAKLQALDGRAEDARATLRRALAEELAAHERLACLHQLITVLGRESASERRQHCREIERRLDEGPDAPHVRLDLAIALCADADGAPEVLWGARRHALRACEGLRDRRLLAHGHRAVGHIVVDLARAMLPVSCVRCADQVGWLQGDLALPSDEAVQLRLTAVIALLLPGPATHPRAIEVARSLVDRAGSMVTNDARAREILARLAWIEQCAASGTGIEPAPAGPKGPLDALPSWLVALLQHPSVEVAPKALSDDVQWVGPALRSRPDAADRVLGALLPLQHRLAEQPRRDLLDTVYTTLQAIPVEDGAGWPALRQAMDAVRARQSDSALRRIASATDRAVGKRPDGDAAETPDHATEPPPEESPEDRARACFERGVALLQAVQRQTSTQDPARLLLESRELLSQAVLLAQEAEMPEAFDFLVSQGNAWKTAPGESLDRALEIYAQAAGLDASSDQRAKLWKVQADALLMRGGSEDIRRAEALLEDALKIRRGWLRSETLVSAAQVALAHPDLEIREREVRATEHLMDAVRADPAHAEQLLDSLLERLARWQRLSPEDPRPARHREELKSVYPGRATEIDAPVAVATPQDVERLVLLADHPVASALLHIHRRLMPMVERQHDPYGVLGRLDPATRAAMEDEADQHSLLGRPEACESVLATLVEDPSSPARPGVLAARVLVLAHLARNGRRTAADVDAATEAACAAVVQVEEARIRVVLIRSVARAWAPDDHADDPVRNFGLSAALLRQCVTTEGGEAMASIDTLTALARSLRYSSDGDPHENLREACRLYALSLAQARTSADPDTIAELLQNLAEAESQTSVGRREDRLRQAVERLREAVTLVRSPHQRAHVLANLAWDLTHLGTILRGLDGQRFLEEARKTFAQVDLALLQDHARRYAEGNRTVCEASLARRSGGRNAEIGVWRAYLATLDPVAHAALTATAKHNLASSLMLDATCLDEVLEGLRLSHESVAVRTLSANPRHHWETALNAGHALLDALRTGMVRGLRRQEAARDAGVWLARALDAARVLGAGEELVVTAFARCELALLADTTAEGIARLEEAWTVVREAAPYLLLHDELREQEARVAYRAAILLAARLGQEALPVDALGVAFVLQGESAEAVARWLRRGHEPARRPLRARLSRPGTVSAGCWSDWLADLDARVPRRVVAALDRVRAAAPDFLADASASESTWRWLQAHPGSAAVAVLLDAPTSLVLLQQVDDTGRRRTWVLGLPIPVPPLPLEALPAIMRGEVPGDARGAQETAATWLRAHLVAPVERFLDAPPRAVLWSPGPGLRLVAPVGLWPGVPVATATSLALPDLTTSPGRRRSTLVVLADPGDRAPEPRLDLRGQGIAALESLARSAAEAGPVRVLGSVGGRFGRTLLPAHPDVRDTPASAHDVLAEAAEHAVIVLIAHGEVDALDDASVLCLDGSGALDRLDVKRLAQSAGRFAGATVVLLACESGRVGDALAEPGGLAGTLISAGARCVVAPLWPVRLDVAVQVGTSVLLGAARGEAPWEVLARVQVDGAEGSPQLGRPPLSWTEREAARALQRLAFVTWVG